MRYLSLFSGIGGFELGIQYAHNLSTQKRVQQGRVSHHSTDNRRTRLASEQPTCVGYSEIDKYAIQIYEKNFPTHQNLGDITKINTEELPGFDLIVGGFPCQSFSIAGKRRGFSDTRGTLFFDIARIIKIKQPRLLLLENVKGLLSHDEGRTFATIIATLDELGYDIQWQVLNSKNFGIPQNRERVFIVGHLRGTPRPEVFPITETNRQNRLPDNAFAWSKSHRTGTRSEDYRRKNRGKIELRIRRGIANTLNTGLGSSSQSTATFVDSNGLKIRRLTPMECERLQGFPDGWTDILSDTQRYKTIGNAVTVNVIEEIMKRIL
jgi:DNA (cytosine-5)-methyltransferase 1